MAITDAPSFSISAPATLLRVAFGLALVFVFGGLIGKWLYRDPDDPDATVHWFALDGAFFVGGAITVAAVLVAWLALAFAIYALQRVFHCVLCCHCCVWCAGGATRAPATPIEHRRLVDLEGGGATHGRLPSINDMLAVRPATAGHTFYSPYTTQHSKR